MARGELFELGGHQGNDAAIVDDGAGGAAAGISHQAEARLPAAAHLTNEIDPATGLPRMWANWPYKQRQRYFRRNPKKGIT